MTLLRDTPPTCRPSRCILIIRQHEQSVVTPIRSLYTKSMSTDGTLLMRVFYLPLACDHINWCNHPACTRDFVFHSTVGWLRSSVNSFLAPKAEAYTIANPDRKTLAKADFVVVCFVVVKIIGHVRAKDETCIPMLKAKWLPQGQTEAYTWTESKLKIKSGMRNTLSYKW